MTPDALIDALQCTVETLSDGTVIYRNAQGQTHRTTGPAIIRPNGDEYWYQYDKLHRTDGPAVVRADGTRAWYVRGSFMTYTLFQHLATLGNVHDT